MAEKNQSANKVFIYPGDRFGRLVVLNEEPVIYYGEGKSRRSRRTFRCLCDCGNETVVRMGSLRRTCGTPTRSCGCIARERTIERSTKHGMCGTPEYQAWVNIKKRCYSPSHAFYEYYGGRGVTVADEWIDDFEAFYAHIGNRPSSSHSVDRIDPNIGYCPGNVKWSTGSEQSQNRRDRRPIFYKGESKTIRQWAKRFGFEVPMFYDLTGQGVEETEALRLIVEAIDHGLIK